MKKVLIAIPTLSSGGVEKSLVSFLACLEKYKEDYSVDLLLLRDGGFFSDAVPDYVNIVTLNPEYYTLYNPIRSTDFFKKTNLKSLIHKIIHNSTHRNNGILYDRKMQILWNGWKSFLPRLDTEYDIAMSYSNGITNYIVIDKVSAKKKILWIHNEYQKLGCDYTFDYDYYEKADEIITISNECVKNFLEVFPEFDKKMFVLENITSKTFLDKMSCIEEQDSNFQVDSAGKAILLSIGRLSEQKGFDIALKAAKNMKEKNFKFVWYIIGEGSDLNMLLEMRKEYNLIEEVVFLGAKKNPYYYIKNCDVFVQTSRFEGKSIVLDEAMILNKPIVVTNYTTVTSSITNGENGTIVEINPDDICEGIIKLYNNPELRKIYSKNLSITATGNEAEIAKYIDHLN